MEAFSEQDSLELWRSIYRKNSVLVDNHIMIYFYFY